LLSHQEDAKPLDRPKRVVIIGTTSYRDKMVAHSLMLHEQDESMEVKIPAFDSIMDLDDLGVCEYNRALIEWADEVHMIWDQRSIGTIGDFFMCFALHKPFKIVYLNPKTILGVMQKYEKKMGLAGG
jgi:hypothetical protein